VSFLFSKKSLRNLIKICTVSGLPCQQPQRPCLSCFIFFSILFSCCNSNIIKYIFSGSPGLAKAGILVVYSILECPHHKKNDLTMLLRRHSSSTVDHLIPGYDGFIKLDHEAGSFVPVYCHLSRLEQNIKE